jgi:hypothetical protein
VVREVLPEAARETSYSGLETRKERTIW